MKPILLFLAVIMAIDAPAQVKKTDKINTHFLEKLLKSKPELFQSILDHPAKKEVQILYTQIDRDKNNIPHFKSYSYRLDPSWYFYPASTVKLPATIFALEKLKQLKEHGVDMESTMITDSAYTGQTKVSADLSSKNGFPSVAQYIKKILLVSDNDAFNRLYEFIGRSEINQKLNNNSLNSSRILNRLAVGDAGEAARHTNPISFYKNDLLLYHQNEQYDSNNYPLELKNLIRGTGYMAANNKLVQEPFNFADKNVFPIADQQALLKKLLFPEVYPAEQQFKLSTEDYNLLHKYMSMYPTESDYPKYDPKEDWAVYCKFLYYGADTNSIPDPNIRIFNKVGDAYGYLIDNAYFVDFKTKVEFMLTAVIQSNEDGIYNDNKYEYETVCFPFMKNLGRVIYDHELKRKKKHLPDLRKFVIKY